MPKNKVETIKVDKQIFLEVIKLKGYSIRKLGAVDQNLIKATDKTIRRQLNEGRMRPEYIEEIAKYLDVDSRVLTGELINIYGRVNLYPLEHIDDFTYFHRQREQFREENIEYMLYCILMLFNRSFSQFEAKNYFEQYLFQKELFEAMYNIITKYFHVDGLGKTDEEEAQRIFAELDYERENHYMNLHVNNNIRPRLLDNPPIGYTKEEINRLTIDEIIQLDRALEHK